MRSKTKNPYSWWALLMERIDQAAWRYETRALFNKGHAWACPGCRVVFYSHVPVCRTSGCGIPRPE